MPETKFTSAAVLGSGSFGTAIAKLLSPRLDRIVLIGRDCETAETINREHRNPHYLSDVLLDENIRASCQIQDALTHPLVIFAVPTSATRETARNLAAAGLPEQTILLSCAKGIEKSTGDRMSQVLREVFPANPIAVLSGPNHAEEIATGMATCAVIGSEAHDLAVRLQRLFTLPHFRSYTSDDLAGIEFGGAVKNVYAIAAGMAHGLGLGDNAVAALVTRALAEMTRLGTALGGRLETFSGLSGMGDLIVTCFSAPSAAARPWRRPSPPSAWSRKACPTLSRSTRPRAVSASARRSSTRFTASFTKASPPRSRCATSSPAIHDPKTVKP
jgi:glycerol-3-phosphate dehydrogenase (NAD(P)+)